MTPEIVGGAGAAETAAILAAIVRYEEEVAAASAQRIRPTSRPAWVAADDVWAVSPERSTWQPSTTPLRPQAPD